MRKPERIVRYKKPKNLLAKLFGCKPSEVSEYRMGLGDESSSEEKTSDEIEEIIRQQHIWGFNDNGIIRFWADEECPFETLLGFFAHEAGHLNGRLYKDLMKEERKANEYQDVAVYAWEQASKIAGKNP